MTARQESEAEWYRAIEIGMIEQEKLDDYRHEQELEVLRANLQELNRLLHATDETRRDNLNMACRLARWRDLLLAERDESRKEIALLKDLASDQERMRLEGVKKIDRILADGLDAIKNENKQLRDLRDESRKEIAALKEMLEEMTDGAEDSANEFALSQGSTSALVPRIAAARALLARKNDEPKPTEIIDLGTIEFNDGMDDDILPEPTETSDPVQAAKWLGKIVEADRCIDDDDTPGHWSDENGGDDDGDWIQDPMRGTLESVTADCAWIRFEGDECVPVFYPIRRIAKREEPK